MNGSSFNTSSDTLNVIDNTTFGNDSVQGKCIIVRYDEMEFIPWDNPDNIVSLQVEKTASRIRDYALHLLFLIGGPGNLVNIMVFYKQGIRDRVNLCLFALSLADLLFLIQAMGMYGEQVHLQFTTKDQYGPAFTFILNNNLGTFYGFQWTSQMLSAIIASERCLCISSPLKFQTLLKTRTMACIILFVNVMPLVLFFFVAFRYRVGCIYDSATGKISKSLVVGEYYKNHKEFITYLDNFVFGAGIPGFAILVVTTATLITTIKLRHIIKWRSETTFSISAREVALTKMLIGNSLLFIVCITPTGLFRITCIFIPDIDVGARHHNFYGAMLWFIQIVSYTNSTFNIFVYYTMGSRYRETFWSLFSRRRKLDKNT